MIVCRAFCHLTKPSVHEWNWTTCSVTLSSPGGTDGELALATSGSAEEVLATVTIKCCQSSELVANLARELKKDKNGWFHLRRAKNDVLGVREHSAHGRANGASDVHEEGIGALDLSLELVHVLFLVGVNINQIDFHFVLDVLSYC